MTISGVTVENSGSDWGDAGIKLDGVQYCRIENTTVTSNNDVGIWLNSSGDCTITDTTASNNDWGIRLNSSGDCTITDTNASNNDYYGIGLVYSGDCTITNTTTDNNNPGLGLFSSNGCTITDTTISNNEDGISLNSSSNCTITNTAVTSNNDVGMLLISSSNCTITDTNASNNRYGIALDFSSNCTITNVTTSNNNVMSSYENWGIFLWSSSGCTITDTTVSNNDDVGIRLSSSSGCTIYHNIFINNSQNSRDDGDNMWYNATLQEGNHWSDFDEPAEGAYDNDGDGIIDSPYTISGGDNQDMYPLMEPYNYTEGEQYTLSTSADPVAGGTVSLNPSSGTYYEGTTVTVTASASSGYEFDHWSGDATGTSTSIDVTMDSDKSVTAHFTEVEKYTLTTNVDPSDGGTVSLDPSGGSYDEGTTVTVTASPASGYQFDYWSGDVSGSSTSVEVTMDENKSVMAYFTEVTQHTLSTSVNPSDGGTVSPSDGIYNEGTTVTVTATPPSGYMFDHWSGDATGTSTSIDVTMDSDKSITAHFTAVNQPPTVSLAAPAAGSTVNGTVTVEGSASDSDGTVESMEVKIDDGSWEDASGTDSWTYSWYTTSVDNGNHTVKARSYDGEDYSDVASVTVEVFNNHPPSVSITWPENGATVNGTVVINGTTTDEDGGEPAINDTLHRRVEVRIGDGSWITALEEWMYASNTTVTTWAYTWNTTEMEDGDYTVDVRAYDGSDYSDVESIIVTVDKEEDGEGSFPGIPGFEFMVLVAAAGVALIWLDRKKEIR